MIPRDFEYYAPTTLDEALELLSKLEDAKVLAGGQSLLPLMKLRVVSVSNIIDIGRIRELRYIKESGNEIAIGALTLHDEVARSQVLRDGCPLLAEAAESVGDQQVRNRGTIGGSVCHADPAADIPCALTALDARVVAVRKGGARRVIPVREFFVDLFTTSLDPDELVTEIRVPKLGARKGVGWSYKKLSRREGDFAIVGVSVLLKLDEKGVCEDVRVALSSVAPTPVRATEVENELTGRRLDESAIAEASRMASKGLSPPSDVHASSEYRREMAKVMVRRALIDALNKAMGGG